MEEKAGCRELVSPPPSPPPTPPPPPPSPPPLFFSHSLVSKMMFFSSIEGEKHYYLRKTAPPEMDGKEIEAYWHGWFILLDKENQQPLIWNPLWCRGDRYSLFNPLTSESICLRPLSLKTNQTISHCVLSLPPDDPASMLILFEMTVPSFIFCRIGIGDKNWVHQTIDAKFGMEKNYLSNPVICDGTLYCFLSTKLMKIELNMPEGSLEPILLDGSIPGHQEIASCCRRYMLESCRELYLIYLVIKKGSDTDKEQVISVEVSRLDFHTMVWEKVESIKNRAFFLSHQSSFSCPATSPTKIKENHVYFTSNTDFSLYSFNMDDKTVSVSSRSPNLKTAWYFPIWIMSDVRLCNILRQAEGELHVERKEIQPAENGEIVKQPVLEQEGKFGKLPLDALFAIGKCLVLPDYVNFRSVNTRFRLAAPAIRWTRAALAGFEGYNSLLPWLMLSRKGDSICTFINVWGEKYAMDVPNNQMKDVKRCYSRDGWCLMLKGRYSLFLWNPFVNRTIQLPNLPHEALPIVGFSSSIDWVVLFGHVLDHISIYYIFLEEGEWHRHSVDGVNVCSTTGRNNFIFTFHDGAFYTFDSGAKLYAFNKEGGFKFLDKVKKPCSSHQSYLVECDGKLLSVFVGFLGRCVRIFRLNKSDMVWVEVENIGNYTIYVSNYSSFAIPATTGMEDRVYFPRFYGENAVYYSLGSKKLHCHGTEEVLGSFDNTKEQLYSSWVQPKVVLDL